MIHRSYGQYKSVRQVIWLEEYQSENSYPGLQQQAHDGKAIASKKMPPPPPFFFFFLTNFHHILLR